MYWAPCKKKMHVSVPQPIFGLKLASIDSSTCQEWNRIIKENYRCELAKKINFNRTIQQKCKNSYKFE